MRIVHVSMPACSLVCVLEGDLLVLNDPRAAAKCPGCRADSSDPSPRASADCPFRPIGVDRKKKQKGG